VLFFNNNYKQSVDTMAQDDLNILLEILKNSIAVRSLYELKEYLRIGDVIKDLEYEFTPLNESSNDRVKKLFTKIGRYIYDTFKVD
jgi:hypothetical protein